LQSIAATIHLLKLPVLLAATAPPATTVFTIILLVLVAFSFIVSGARVAFFSLTLKDLNLLKTKEQPAYKKIVDLMEEPKLLLGSLLIANNFINIAIIILSSLIIDDTIHMATNMWWVSFVVKVLVISTLLLMFCEIIPRVLAASNNVRFAEYTGLPVELIFFTFKRMGGWLVNYTDAVEKRLGSGHKGQYGSEELDAVIGKEENEDEKNILMGIAKFDNITVRQIMRSRLDVNGIDEKTPFNEVIRRIEELHYSRLPVYKNDLDEVIGIINTKDVVPYIDSPADFDWLKLMRPPYFVHEQKLIKDLLREFQTKRIHFAVVVDEFGGTSGIVTLEDVMEEIIGDIRDEFDEEESGFKKLDDNNFIFDGKTTLNDACKLMEVPVDTFENIKGNSESLGGLVLELAGKIPQINEVVPSGDFEFMVLEVAKNRLQKIKITIKPKAAK